MDLAPGARRRTPAGVALAVLDQRDLVLGIWVALLPVWTMPMWLQRSPSPARRDPRSDQRDRPRDRGAHGTGLESTNQLRARP
jgi:hypothetical protein